MAIGFLTLDLSEFLVNLLIADGKIHKVPNSPALPSPLSPDGEQTTNHE